MKVITIEEIFLFKREETDIKLPKWKKWIAKNLKIPVAKEYMYKIGLKTSEKSNDSYLAIHDVILITARQFRITELKENIILIYSVTGSNGMLAKEHFIGATIDKLYNIYYE